MRPLPLAAALGRGSWWRYAAVAAAMTGAVVLYAWVDLHFSLPWNPDRPTLPSFPAAPLANACDGIGKTTSELAAVTAARAPIPNIVHYVWLLADPVVFSLGFTVFVTVYSSHLFLRPDRIYIHTDASPELWDRAKTAGDTWTKRQQIRGWDGRITLRYVLAQQSNYARAVFPAVWHAVQAGVIPVEEAS
ncbi:uncharacterized protein THITE_2043312 [Thermothielavioides terrestris NRRL 8126]|uniref:Uncharacterized protein n=1 Tax=Thermothielavioides terrestris (strain ATCC 38088 / NRRL 8126) TaxID=578455 RepID=G2QY54_THETT|nr:uncharacterized protein THITE_2043312 [Thermothielavioides terrestris NRRL 8126]AEO65348.1 hypothetical protein THITE_2043312 [Thermothielavioides terrestris NRRL 8126]